MSRKRLEAILKLFSISGDKEYAITQIEKVFRDRKEKAPAFNQETEKFLLEAFTGIYNAYPRKVGKPAALKAIRRAMEKEVKAGKDMYIALDFLLEKTEEYAIQRAGEDAKFTPHPATWFNQERYNDVVEKKEWEGAPDETQIFR